MGNGSARERVGEGSGMGASQCSALPCLALLPCTSTPRCIHPSANTNPSPSPSSLSLSPPPPGHYTVAPGGLIFCSGQIPQDENKNLVQGGIQAETVSRRPGPYGSRCIFGTTVDSGERRYPPSASCRLRETRRRRRRGRWNEIWSVGWMDGWLGESMDGYDTCLSRRRHHC